MQLSPLDAELVALSRDHLLPLVLGMARIGACLVWVPYLAPGVMPAKMTRTVVTVMVLIGLWLWRGEGPAVWLADFAIMCGF